MSFIYKYNSVQLFPVFFSNSDGFFLLTIMCWHWSSSQRRCSFDGFTPEIKYTFLWQKNNTILDRDNKKNIQGWFDCINPLWRRTPPRCLLSWRRPRSCERSSRGGRPRSGPKTCGRTECTWTAAGRCASAGAAPASSGAGRTCRKKGTQTWGSFSAAGLELGFYCCSSR